ncbi:MAG: DUF790 family protein [Deltaproteobacteria bacterium]|nr:DUF790 family protein [Deltaproteobacteria bacterium]
MSSSVTSKILAPRWLVPEDDRAIARLVALYQAHVGLRRRELDEALARPEPTSRSPSGGPRPLTHTPSASVLSRRKLELVRAALDAHLESKVVARVTPRALREALFVASATGTRSRDELSRAFAQKTGLSPAELEDALFADLPSEQVISFERGAAPSVDALRTRANRVLVEQLFARSREIVLTLHGGARAVVRTAQLRGLLVSARRREAEPTLALPGMAAPEPPIVLTISGPFALFRHTRLYASATRALVPVLSRARFEALVRIPGPSTEWTFRLGSDDPFVAACRGTEPGFDSAIEEAFARRFTKLAPQWELVREPEPIPIAKGRMIFPDFLIVDRRTPSRRAWLEIVGYWSPEYLANKLASLDEAKLDRLIVCVSERLAVRDAAIPSDARIVRFKGRVDPRVVLAHLESMRWPS